MFDILKIVLSAILVLLTAWFVLDKQQKEQQRQREHDLRMGTKGNTLPTRLRAYERLMLVLERTLPTNLLVATIEPGMNCLTLQSKLLTSIRDEFAHNASQQIYISNELWTAIRAAQESSVKLVNMCAAKLQQDEPAPKLAEMILNLYAQLEQSPNEIAAELLKKEVRILLN